MRADVELTRVDETTEALLEELTPLAEEQLREWPWLIGAWLGGRFLPRFDHVFVVSARDHNDWSRAVGLVHWRQVSPQLGAAPSCWIAVKRRGYGRAAMRRLAFEMVQAGVRSINSPKKARRAPEHEAASSILELELREEFVNLKLRAAR